MQTSGDVVDLDLGQPEEREAGFLHPAIVITAQRILDADPTVVHVVPLTSTRRKFHSEIVIELDKSNGLDTRVSSAVSAPSSGVAAEDRGDPRQHWTTESVADSRNARRHPRHRVTFERSAAPDWSAVIAGRWRRTFSSTHPSTDVPICSVRALVGRCDCGRPDALRLVAPPSLMPQYRRLDFRTDNSAVGVSRSRPSARWGLPT